MANWFDNKRQLRQQVDAGARNITNLRYALSQEREQNKKLRAQIVEYEKALTRLRWDFNQSNFETLEESREFARTELERIRGKK